MKIELVSHHRFPPSSVQSVEVELTATDWDDVLLDFEIKGSNIVIPEWRTPARADQLWGSTCFEIFLKRADLDSYFEFNFSPSSCWAAYAFEGYRSGMRDLAMVVPPHVEFDPDRPYCLSVDLDLSDVPNVPLLASISAVIEESDGSKSYWALAHPDEEKPDFHHLDCFVLQLPAARIA